MESVSSQPEKDALSINDIRELLWGPNLKDEVFSRWSQGFNLSSTEPTALLQHEGGPCAVIAPVQGYLLKNILFGDNPVTDLCSITEGEALDYLTTTLADILSSVSTGTLTIVTRVDSSQHCSGCQRRACQRGTEADLVNDSACDEMGENKGAARGGGCEHCKARLGDGSCQRDDAGTVNDASTSCSPKKPREDLESFHSSLRCVQCTNSKESWPRLKTLIQSFFNKYGILLFMYSVIVTKGIEEIILEVQDPGEPLIDGTYGHGSQSLINLFLTGKAVSNVWDNDKEVTGLRLRGVNCQSTVGFLSYLEHLRYCEVGWYLKNPAFPIWLLASETHLTVLFSKERGIVYEETKEQTARRVFLSFDTESNGFVQSVVLGQLLAALDLVSEKEYVDIMRHRLDNENLGIITLSRFLDEFFPDDPVANTPNKFKVYHYNGLCRASSSSRLEYHEADVTLEDEPDVQVVTDSSPIKLCLQTKWPSIELQWVHSTAPSIY